MCFAYYPVILLIAAVVSSNVRGATPVQQQLDSLIAATQGKRLGMITNPSGCDEDGNLDANYLLAQPGVEITAFFAPEHGLRGTLPPGENDGDYIDPESGIPVYAVYGSRNAPTAAQLANVDALVFDLQDVGVRFYTFVWTMTHCMEAAALRGKAFYVIDRPNPIDGMRVEGAPNTVNYNLIGRLASGAPFGVSTRHGMTVGEIARMWNEEWMSPKVELHVIPMTDWTRDQEWAETGRAFIPPSPNMRTTNTATVYPATCIFEGSNLSEGRGTDKPFEKIGAPFINAENYAAALTALELPGVRFDPISFTPNASKFWGRPCHGVEVVVTNPDAFDPLRTGLSMLKTIYHMHPTVVSITAHAANLMGVPGLETSLKTKPVDEIIAGWQGNLAAFRELRRKYLLYPEPAPVMGSTSPDSLTFEISWSAFKGRDYRLHHRSSLSMPWAPLGGDVTASGPLVQASQPLESGSGFYLLELLP